MSAIDFSDADKHDRLLRDPFNVELNAAVDLAVLTAQREARGYLGASGAGSECARKIQFDWMCSSPLSAQQSLIFGRGHAAEATMRAQLQRAGYEFASPEALEFDLFEYFSGHCDGIIIAGPRLPGIYFQFPAIWECKCLGQKGWRAIVRDGLTKANPTYATQIALYQLHLKKTNPALYTVINANTCEVAHFPVPFDAERAERATQRIKRVIEAIKAGELLPRAYRDPSDRRCVRYCAHGDRCWRLPP
jgi:hypothetical protein